MNPTASRDDDCRMERLLRAAAEFEPDAPAPEGLAFRALAGRPRRRPARVRRLIAQGACTLAGLVAAALLWPTMDAERPDIPPTVRPGSVGPGPVATARPANRGRKQAAETGYRPSVTPGPSPTMKGPPHRPRASRPRPENGTTPHRRVRPMWTTQVVQRSATGVLTPAWVAGPAPDGRAIEVSPAVVDVPLGDGDNGLLDSGLGGRVRPASYGDTEENR